MVLNKWVEVHIRCRCVWSDGVGHPPSMGWKIYGRIPITDGKHIVKIQENIGRYEHMGWKIQQAIGKYEALIGQIGNIIGTYF